jgi:hypothetical protein
MSNDDLDEIRGETLPRTGILPPSNTRSRSVHTAFCERSVKAVWASFTRRSRWLPLFAG